MTSNVVWWNKPGATHWDVKRISTKLTPQSGDPALPRNLEALWPRDSEVLWRENVTYGKGPLYEVNTKSDLNREFNQSLLT